jgi:uncharacterized protein YbjT (DUF2867 family)
MKRILVTGATGKVGSNFIHRVLSHDSNNDLTDITIRALCHNRPLDPPNASKSSPATSPTAK